MHRRFVKTVLLTSLATFGLSTAILLPGTLQADGPTQDAAAVPVPLKLSTDHFDLSLKLADPNLTTTAGFARNIDPGAAPKLTLEATNKTGVVLTIPVKLNMSSTSLASMISRTPSKAKEIWHYDREITLKPGASDTVDVTPDAQLDPRSIVTIGMTVGDQTVYPLRVGVKAPGAK